MRTVFGSKQPPLRAAVLVTDQQLQLAVIAEANTAQPKICGWFDYGFASTSEYEQVLQQLKHQLRQHHWHRLPYYGLLANSDYQLVITDIPDVPATEINSALRWQLQDLVTLDLEQAVIQSFLQADGKKLYGVVAPKSVVQRQVNVAKTLNLPLVAIDIPELSYRNYIATCIHSEQSVALALLQQNLGTLLIYQQGNLYFSRRFTINYASPAAPLPEDELILELQRSLDYYERQMGQVPPVSMVFSGWINDSQLSVTIRESFQQSLSPLAVTITPTVNQDISVETASALMGCCLRQEAA